MGVVEGGAEVQYRGFRRVKKVTKYKGSVLINGIRPTLLPEH